MHGKGTEINRTYLRSLIWIFVILEMSQTLHAQFNNETPWPTNISASASRIRIGDFNGDRLDDILINEGNGHWTVAISKGKGFQPPQYLYDWTTNFGSGYADSCFVVGDFNGDGLNDIALIWPNGTSNVALTKQYQNGQFYFENQTSPWSTNIFPGSQGIWVGDFDGDGLSDLISDSSGVWKVALSNGNGFNSPSQWCVGQGTGSPNANLFFGDFNGDGRCDRATIFPDGTSFVALSKSTSNGFNDETSWSSSLFSNSNGIWVGNFDGDSTADIISVTNGTWRVAKSTGNQFILATPNPWVSGQGSGSPKSNLFVGDFNGDGYCDRGTYYTNGVWYVATSSVPSPKICATLFSNWYDPDPNGWGWDMSKPGRDSLQNPITGWGVGQKKEFYHSQYADVIGRQVNAMKMAGINLIVIDFTNCFYKDIGAGASIRTATNNLFQYMAGLSPADRIPIAFALGYEFWGPRVTSSVTGTFGAWPGWPAKKVMQDSAFHRILNEYAYHSPYDNIYFRYLKKPLVLAWLNDGTDNPLIDTNNTRYPIWHNNQLTIRNSVYWSSTWQFQSTDPTDHIYHNGQDSRYPSWGLGALFDGTRNLTHNFPNAPSGINTHTPPLPYNAECMAIMPGYWMAWKPSIITNVKRDTVYGEGSRGIYYIKSWLEILKAKPRMTMICSWNDWNEGTAIEACDSTDGWKNYQGSSQPDWYLQITKAYSDD